MTGLFHEAIDPVAAAELVRLLGGSGRPAHLAKLQRLLSNLIKGFDHRGASMRNRSVPAIDPGAERIGQEIGGAGGVAITEAPHLPGQQKRNRVGKRISFAGPFGLQFRVIAHVSPPRLLVVVTSEGKASRPAAETAAVGASYRVRP